MSQQHATAELIAALKATRDALAAWVEIADEHDQRDSDSEALAAAESALARAESEPVPVYLVAWVDEAGPYAAAFSTAEKARAFAPTVGALLAIPTTIDVHAVPEA